MPGMKHRKTGYAYGGKKMSAGGKSTRLTKKAGRQASRAQNKMARAQDLWMRGKDTSTKSGLYAAEHGQTMMERSERKGQRAKDLMAKSKLTAERAQLYKRAGGTKYKKASQSDMVKAMKAGGGVKLAKILASKNGMKVVPKMTGGAKKKGYGGAATRKRKK